jgi:hypothetical protein
VRQQRRKYLVRFTDQASSVGEQLAVGQMSQAATAARHELGDGVTHARGCLHASPYTRDFERLRAALSRFQAPKCGLNRRGSTARFYAQP